MQDGRTPKCLTRLAWFYPVHQAEYISGKLQDDRYNISRENHTKDASPYTPVGNM